MRLLRLLFLIKTAFLSLAIFLNVLAKALALPVHPGFVIGVHFPFSSSFLN